MKTNNTKIHEIIRVNQAGEFGAKRIYEGQLAVFPKDKTIKEMAKQEQEHLQKFNKLMIKNKRRQKDFLECGENISIDTLINDIENRDFKDSNRTVSPLKRAIDSMVVDTTNTTIDAQVNELIKIIKNKRKNLYGEF
jgi:cytidylate kinase